MSDTVLEIIANKKTRNYWQSLYAFRELFFVLAWRDILIRYKQTFLGILWSVLRPFLTMVVFTLVFGKLAKLPTEGDTPYALLVFAGLLPWQFFASAIQVSSDSLIANTQLISKIYFPRLIIPMSSIMTALVDTLISLVILFGLMVYYQFLPDWKIFLLPCFILLGVLSTIGIALIISTLNVFYRDFRYVIPFIVQFGLYISPVGFSSAAIPDQWRFLYSLNPMVGVIDGYRWSILGQNVDFYLPGFIASIILTIVAIFIGFKVFFKMEREFADRI